MTKKKAIYIRVTEEEKKKIVEAAGKERRSISSFVLYLLDRWKK